MRDAAHEAAFRRAGMLRVRSVEELFATAGTLASWSGARRTRLHSGRLAIVANGRGPALLAADLLADLGGELAPRPATLSALALALGPVPAPRQPARPRARRRAGRARGRPAAAPGRPGAATPCSSCWRRARASRRSATPRLSSACASGRGRRSACSWWHGSARRPWPRRGTSPPRAGSRPTPRPRRRSVPSRTSWPSSASSVCCRRSRARSGSRTGRGAGRWRRSSATLWPRAGATSWAARSPACWTPTRCRRWPRCPTCWAGSRCWRASGRTRPSAR